ncbi:recombinase family protein [Nocardia alba]|uniref:recombinase family protein n=1 Tax=Nocardia alba TaxID=225051 RepID=UPI001FB53B3B|nr:recombinase family protein [Nocardia alba]
MRVGFRSLHEAIDTTTPGGRLVFHVFAALAEFIRELIVDGTEEDLAAARSRGQRLGRSPAMTAEQIRQARATLTRPEETVSSVARLLGVSRSTIYKYLPEIGPIHIDTAKSGFSPSTMTGSFARRWCAMLSLLSRCTWRRSEPNSATTGTSEQRSHQAGTRWSSTSTPTWDST